MEHVKTLTTLSLSLIVLIVIIFNTAFSGGVATCDNYIFNVYMYILIALFGTIFMYLALNDTDPKNKIRQYIYNNIGIMIGFFILSIVPYFVMAYYSTNQIITHLMFLILIAMYGVSFHFGIAGINNKILIEALLQCIVVMISLSIIVFTYPDAIKSSWNYQLLIILILLIIAQTVTYYVIGPSDPKFNYYQKLFSYFGIVLFSAFILVDTKKVIERSKTCIVPNYPQASINIFLDGMNLFLDLIVAKR